MDLTNYFENSRGLGVLATVDTDGRPNAALYARPHVLEKNSLAFIMAERKTHANISVNPHACYLFVESEKPLKGLRLYLTLVEEKTDRELIGKLRRRHEHNDKEKNLFLVTFKIDQILPLTGNG